MIVQPSPVGPRSRPRRALRVVALVVPVVLLAGVVALGVVGPRRVPEPAPIAPATPGEGAVVDRAPVVAEPSPAAMAAAPAFPAQVGGLRVHGVRWTLEARNRGLARGVIAVAGYLVVDAGADGACGPPAAGVVVPFCERTGVLAETPWSGAVAPEARLPPFHLHPQLPAGVRVPVTRATATGAGDGPLPVVVLARFGDPRARSCVPEGRHCGQELVVERVAWVDGDDVQGIVSVDPRAAIGGLAGEWLRGQAAFAVSTLVPGGYPLLAVLVRPETLASMHPDAASGLRDDRSVWYVRGLHEAGEPGRIDWLVVDGSRQLTLAYGSIGTTREAAGS